MKLCFKTFLLMISVTLLAIPQTSPTKRTPAPKLKGRIVKTLNGKQYAKLPWAQFPSKKENWKVAEVVLMNLLPTRTEANGKMVGPWKVSPAPKNLRTTTILFEVQEVADEKLKLIAKDNSGKILHESELDAKSPAKILVAPNDKFFLLLESRVSGDMDRNVVRMATLGEPGLSPLVTEPSGTCEISADSRFVLVETVDGKQGTSLIDLQKWEYFELDGLWKSETPPFFKGIGWLTSEPGVVGWTLDDWTDVKKAQQWEIKF